MNILFVSIAAPPIITGAECLQVGKFIKYLSADNSLCLVTTNLPPDNHWQIKDVSQNSLLKNVKQTIALPTLTSFGKYTGFVPRLLLKNQAFKPDSDFLFHHQARIAASRIKSTPDIIYSRSAPFSSAIMGLRLKKLLNKSWVMHLSDPWADSAFKKSNKYNIKMEKESFENADKISFTTSETISFYEKKYPEFSDKYFLCPNVYDVSEIAVENSSFLGEKVNLLYSGEIYGRRSIRPIVETLKLLDKEKQDLLDIRFIGNLNNKSLELINSSGLKCLKYDGFVTPDESYARQRDSDILISIDPPVESEVDKVYLPSKIQDYMAARKFILALTGKHSATYNIVEGNYGVCFDYGEKDELLNFWNKLTDAFIAGDYSLLKLNPLDKTFEAEANAKKLIKIFKAQIENKKMSKV